MQLLPKAIKLVVATTAVKNIITAVVAAATAGWTPISSIRGPFTIPPPIPNMPAQNPANIHIMGYTIVCAVQESDKKFKL